MKRYEQEHKNEVINILQKHDHLTTREITLSFGHSWGYTNRLLEKLKDEKHVDYVRVGTTKVWWYLKKNAPIIVDGVKRGIIIS